MIARLENSKITLNTKLEVHYPGALLIYPTFTHMFARILPSEELLCSSVIKRIESPI